MQLFRVFLNFKFIAGNFGYSRLDAISFSRFNFFPVVIYFFLRHLKICSSKKKKMENRFTSWLNANNFSFLIRLRIKKEKNLVNFMPQTPSPTKKTLAQQSCCCARKAGFLYLLKQQFSLSQKHKY